MNNVIFVIALASISITACNNSPKSASSPSEVQGTKEETLYACQMHPEVKGKKGDKCSKCGMDLTVPVEATEHDHDDAHDHHGNDSKDASNQDEMKDEKTDSTMGSKQASYTLSSVYDDYFSLTEALAKDDGKLAQKAAKLLFSNIANVDANKMSSDEKATWTKYKTKLSFDAEHIKSVDENEHQREHFVSLSKNMYEVMKVIKNDKTVYYQHCPMANDNKGANWLSLNSKVSNPYMGKAMPTCGKTVEIIKY